MRDADRKIVYPRPLPAHPQLAVWAPSSPAPYLFPHRFQRALTALERSGYRVEVGESCRRTQRYEPGFAEVLVEELHTFLSRPDVDGVVFATGGWTTIAVLPLIDWTLVRDSAKPIIGYSDATAMLLATYTRAGLVTFHGPMVVSEWGEPGGPWPFTVEHFRQAMHGRHARTVTPPAGWTDESQWWDRDDTRPRTVTGPGAWRVYRRGRGSGPLVGGDLPTLGLLVGTPYLPSLAGAVLFVEGEGLSPDVVLARLTQLRLAGCLDGIAGLIVGRHARPRPTSAGLTSFDSALDFVLAGLDIPVLLDVDLGHTEPMLTLPIGGPAHIDTHRDRFTLGEWRDRQ